MSDGTYVAPAAAASTSSGAQIKQDSNAMDTSTDAPVSSSSSSNNAPAAASSSSSTDPKDPNAAKSSEIGATRDDFARIEELNDIISFPVVYNDGKPDHMIALIACKNIFSAQLPKMPKEYIVRLVLDRNHRSMCIMKQKKVIGGICFRPFLSQGFAEIVFCAITSTEQVKGYGTRLMNQLKEHVKKEGIQYFLTYADNYAIGYFKKQGFTKIISQPRDRWVGFIKDYDGGTLMECNISHLVDYLNLGDLIKKQRAAVHEQIKTISNSHIIYPGLECFKHLPPPTVNNQNATTSTTMETTTTAADGTTAAAAASTAHEAPKQLIAIADIPGVKEAGWVPPRVGAGTTSTTGNISSTTTNTRTSAAVSDLSAKLGAILKGLKASKDAWPFVTAVDGKVVPDYYTIITQPMDLEKMTKKLNNFEYKSREQFENDAKIMIKNCQTYNSPETTYYRCAVNLEQQLEKLLVQQFGEKVEK